MLVLAFSPVSVAVWHVRMCVGLDFGLAFIMSSIKWQTNLNLLLQAKSRRSTEITYTYLTPTLILIAELTNRLALQKQLPCIRIIYKQEFRSVKVY
jgi:hypothetical protein